MSRYMGGKVQRVIWEAWSRGGLRIKIFRRPPERGELLPLMRQIKPIKAGKSRAEEIRLLMCPAQRAVTVMSLIQSAKLDGHDPYRYLKDVLERLPAQRVSRLGDLFPHGW